MSPFTIVVAALRRARRLAVVTAIGVMAALFVLPGVSHAQENVAPLAVDNVNSFVIAKPTWTIITGILLPIVIGLITKASADPRFQAILGIVVAAIGAIVIRATTVDGAVFTTALLLDVALVYLPQIASYLGVWKQFNLNQKMLPTKGLG